MFDYKSDCDKYSVIYSGGVIFLASTILFTLVFFIFGYTLKFEYMIYIYLYGLSLCFQTLYSYLARAFGYNISFAVSGIISTLVNVITTIILIIFLGMDYKALYISYILSMLVQCFILEFKIHLIQMYKKSIVNFSTVKAILYYSLPLCINSISYWFLTGYSRIAISQQLGNEFNGYFAVATKFGSLISVIFSCFTMAWQELAYVKTKDDVATGIFYSKATNLYIKLLLCCVICLIPIIYIIYPFFVADNYTESKVIIPLYIIATILSIFSSFLSNILTAYKKTKIIFCSTIIACIVNIIIIYMFINQIKLLTVPIALFTGFGVNCLIRIVLIKKLITYKINIKTILFFVPILCIISIIFYTDLLWLNIMSMFIALTVSFLVFKKYLYKFIKNRRSNSHE